MNIRRRAPNGSKGAAKRGAKANRRLATRDPDAALQAAIDAVNGGDPETALDLAEQVLRATGHEVAVQVAVHAALHMDTDAAISALIRLSKLYRKDPGLFNDLGGLLCQAKRFDEAEKQYRHALRLRPNHAPTLANLGQALLGSQKLEEAAAAFRHSIAIDAAFAPAHSSLASVLEQSGEREAAIDAHRAALAIEPDNRIYQDNLEKAYLRAGTGQDIREQMYRGYLQSDPDDAATVLALGGAVYDQRRFDEAEEIFKHALTLKLEPKQDARARLALSQISFIKGDHQAGWENYQWRLKNGDIEIREFPFPMWQGQDIRGSTLLIWEEQGLGECLMFLQFAALLVVRGVRIVYETKPRFAPVVASAFPEFEIVLVDDLAVTRGRGDIDYQAAAGDLGQWLWADFVKMERRPGPRFVPEQSSAYRARYIADTGADAGTKLVGLAWKSHVSRLGPSKSLQLEDLASILRRPDLLFVDLQYGETREDIEKAEKQFACRIYHDETFDQRADLVPFFAQVGALDAVVSISNTTLHVAGSIGVPTAGLLSTVPMWRWEFHSDRAVWYPSVKLFRQSEPGDWSGPATEAGVFISSVTSG